jgi:GNAT superfamily N-acetyltransferase
MSDVRLLTFADVPGAMRLKEAANWNQTEEDWRNVMRLEPEGCFGLDCDGRLAASATAVRFGSDLAWIGMVLTDPAYRGRGFARRLMQHAIEYCVSRGVEWIKLDATDMGKPLYCSLGFEDECAIERWGRQPAPCDGPELPPMGEIPRGLDHQAFGADRTALLALLKQFESACGPWGGYAMGRPGSKAAYFGPCVSRSPEEARELLRWFLARHAGQMVFWDVLETNPAALELAREFGFAPLRKLWRQGLRGSGGARPFVHNDALTYGIAGFEYG